MKINSFKERYNYLESVMKEIDSAYFLVTFDSHTEPIYINKFKNWDKNGDWFLESPCQLMKFQLFDEEDNVVNGKYHYEIESFQSVPFLPDKLDEMVMISEDECKEYMIKSRK